MPYVECYECEHTVELPNGLALSEIDDNPGWKGVSCPWCYELGDDTTISAKRVAAAFGQTLNEGEI